MRKLTFTVLLAVVVVFAANAQQKISSQIIWNDANALNGSKNGSQLSRYLPKPAQTGNKVMLLNEGFDGISTLIPGGWNMQNLSTTIGTVPNWFQGVSTAFTAYDGADTAYIAVNFNSTTGANTISNWLMTPVLNIENGDVLTFWTRTSTPGGSVYPDRLQVRMSQNGASVNAGTTETSVGDFTTLLLEVNPSLTTTGYPTVWTQYSVTISGVTGIVPGRFAFRYFVTNGGPSGANSNYIGLDLVQYDHPVAGTYDVSMTSADSMEYSIYPLEQIGNQSFSGIISNVGPTPVTNAVMTATVNDGASNIWTGTSAAVATIAVGNSQNVTTTTAWTPVVGDFSVTELATIAETDVDLLNDSDVIYFSVSDSVYARDDGTVTGGLGIGAGNGGWLGNQYTINTSTDITSISYFVTAGYTNERTACVVWDMVAGEPNAVVASTDTILYPNDSAAFYTIKIAGGPVTLAPGEYVVTVCEFDSTVQVGLTNDIFTLGKTWVNWPTSPAGGWANNEFFGSTTFMKTYVIRPNFGETDYSINDYINNSNIIVYPNPSDGLISIKNAKNGKLVVSDITGRQIFKSVIDSDHFELNLSKCDMGMYFINIDNNVYKVVVK